MLASTFLLALPAVFGLAVTSPADSPDISLEARSGVPVSLAISPDGACKQTFIFNDKISLGVCTTLPRGGNYGAFLENRFGQHCVFKFLSGGGCSGQATTWYGE